MSKIFTFLMVVFTVPAFADQVILCRELNKDGSLRANGGKVRLELGLTKAGEVSYKRSKVGVAGFEKKGSNLLADLSLSSIDEGRVIATRNPYTTVFIDNNGYLDIQLQFDQHVIGQNFRNVKAKFVIGSDDASPENSFAFGYPVSCNSRN